MGEFAAARGDVGEHRGDGFLGEPAQRGAGRVGGGQRLPQQTQRGVGGAVRVGEQFPQPQLETAVGAWARLRAGLAGGAVGKGRDGAALTDRLGEGAGADRFEASTADASC